MTNVNVARGLRWERGAGYLVGALAALSWGAQAHAAEVSAAASASSAPTSAASASAAPAEPAAAESAPTQSGPAQPAQTESAPTEPASAQPAPTEPASAEQVPAEAAPADDAAEQEPEKEDSWGTVGFRGFGGVLAAEGSSYGLLGAGFLMGVPVWRSLELEGSVAWAGRFDSGGFVVTELMAKWVFETDGKLAPHVTLGPLLSVDIDREATFAGGLVAGGGASWWLDRRWGLVADVNYRLLAGSVVEHVVTGALGVSYRF